MKCQITIECDHCLSDLEVDVEQSDYKEMMKAIPIQAKKKLDEKGWHHLKNCLCPYCKENVGKRNCMNCVHVGMCDFNWTCKRTISSEDGFTEFEGSIVSKYDCCDFFKNR